MTCSKVSSGFLVFAVGGLLLAGVAEVARGQCEANEFAKITAFDAELDDHYGQGVAICGDLAVVGSRLDDDMGGDAGSVYVYRLDCENGTWVWEEPKLYASDATPNGWFGMSVACEEDRIVVGAGPDNQPPTGSAYVFRFDPLAGEAGEWSQEGPPLTAFDAAGGDMFGVSVSISGDRVVVGAIDHEHSGAPVDSGAAYVFQYNPAEDVWEEQCELLDSAPIEVAQFGISVAVSGDLVAVGADQDGDETLTHSGSVSLFQWDGASCNPLGELPLGQPSSENHFGRSVSINVDGVLVVGASQRDGGGSGEAYVFEDADGDGTWTELSQLTASDGVTGDNFGKSVSISGDIIVVGAHEAVGGNRIGAAYAFWKPPIGGWTDMTEAAKLVAFDAAVGDTFGSSVSVSGSMAIIGAADDRNDLGISTGSASIFHGLSDCNGNEVLDICDIAEGTSVDEDANGTPDECECEGGGNGVPDDLDGDGVLNEADDCPCTSSPGGVDTQGRPLGDIDEDCDVDLDDYDFFALNFVNGADCLNGDANKDGAIDPLDSGYVLARFGTCPSCP